MVRFLAAQLVIFFLCFPGVQAQMNIQGVLLFSNGEPSTNATITIKDSMNGNLVTYTLSKADGSFRLKILKPKTGIYFLIIEHIQSAKKIKQLHLSINELHLDLGEVILEDTIKQLKNIYIKSAPLPFSIRGDTIEFSAKSYKTPEMRKVEDLLRNIQGFDLGTDGKISFNGKEVDRILIEGEDLTEKNYQLLSKNLNANLVNKIQVINNYSTDRLLKEVESSGKIGINLTIDEKFKNKLSGSIEAGSGIGGREYLDNNLILLTRKTKLLSFLNFNETGIPANANLQYYYNKHDQVPHIPLNAYQAKGFLQTGVIYLPPLGQTYTKNNEDMAAFVINSWKVGEAVKMKALAGTGRYMLLNNSSGMNQFQPADGNGWEISQYEKSASSLSEAIIKFSITHDHKKNNTGFINADILGSRSTGNYSNLSFGDLRDTLAEKLSGKGLFYAFSMNETIRLKGRLILKAILNLDRENISQDFKVRTNRYQEYFFLDSNFLLYQQKLKGVLLNQEFDLAVYGKSKLTNWYSGFRVLGQKSSYDAISNSTDPGKNATIQLGQAPSAFYSLQATAYGMLNRIVQKKGELSIGISTGAGTAEMNQDYIFNHKTAPIFRTVLGYKLALSPIKSISVQYNYSSQLPGKNFFHPLQLLSGQAAILNPADQLSKRSMHQFNFTFASQKLHKGSGIVFYTSYSHVNGSYTYSNARTAEYALLFYLPQNGNQLFSAHLKMEKYASLVKTKFSLLLASFYSANKLTYNEEPSRNQIHNVSIQPKLVTALKGPVNLEASMSGMYTRNKTVPESGIVSDYELWQYQGYGKIKLRPGKKIYLAVMYNFYILSPKNFFHTMDLFTNFLLNQAWAFSFNVHNLFNSSSIVQRQFGINSMSEQRFGLVERYILFKVNWNF